MSESTISIWMFNLALRFTSLNRIGGMRVRLQAWSTVKSFVSPVGLLSITPAVTRFREFDASGMVLLMGSIFGDTPVLTAGTQSVLIQCLATRVAPYVITLRQVLRHELRRSAPHTSTLSREPL